MSFTNILVPVDFSPASWRAVEVATWLAQRSGARVTLMHACSPEPVFGAGTELPPEMTPVVTQLTERIASRQRDQLEAMRTPQVSEALLLAGPPTGTICARVREGGHDLVVMGTHGRTGIDRVLLGSIASRVLRRSPVPVLVTPDGDDEIVFEEILVPVDFSEWSERALSLAAAVAELSGGRVSLLHVTPSLVELRELIRDREALETIEQERRAETGARLQEMAEAHVSPEVLRTIWGADGHPVKQIVGACEDIGFDLVVMGSRGRSGLERALLGSVTERVVRLASLPILVSH